jgi:hypothetical protein
MLFPLQSVILVHRSPSSGQAAREGTLTLLPLGACSYVECSGPDIKVEAGVLQEVPEDTSQHAAKGTTRQEGASRATYHISKQEYDGDGTLVVSSLWSQ